MTRTAFISAPRSSGVAKWPAIAVAAATAGETRWVRPPRPWRPSKLRFDVRRAALAGRELVGVHRQAHRAARLAPVEAGGAEDLCRGPRPRPAPSPRCEPGHDHRAHARVHRAGPSTTAAAARRSSMRLFVHEPMNTVSTAMSRIGVPALEAHVLERARRRSRASSGRRTSSGIGDDAVDRRSTCAGLVPQVTCGRERRRVEDDLLVERRAVVGDERAPVVERRAPSGALRRVRAALEVGERRVVGRDQPGLGAGLDRHVADRHAAFHRQRPDRRAAVLDDVADAAAGADAADDREDRRPWR